MKEDNTGTFRSKLGLIGTVLSIGKGLASIAENSVKLINKTISRKVQNLIHSVIYLVVGLFFLLTSFILFILAAYHAILRYIINDPMVAAGILGGTTLIVALIVFWVMNKRINE